MIRLGPKKKRSEYRSGATTLVSWEWAHYIVHIHIKIFFYKFVPTEIPWRCVSNKIKKVEPPRHFYRVIKQKIRDETYRYTECSGKQSHGMPSWSDYGMFRGTKSLHAFLVRLRNVQGNKVMACLPGPITECSGKQSHGMPSWSDYGMFRETKSWHAFLGRFWNYSWLRVRLCNKK
jgi:hypothetical protein